MKNIPCRRIALLLLLLLPVGRSIAQSIMSFVIGDIKFRMIRVEGGKFLMGSENGIAAPLHQVTLDTYYIGETEVTQELWKEVMNRNPSWNRGDENLPVENVSWVDCQKFAEQLSKMAGHQFRLPTEAEWEYAARGGQAMKGTLYSGSANLDDVAWYTANSKDTSKYQSMTAMMQGLTDDDRQTHPVKTKQPNELGLYDMSGNVYEWCQDWLGAYKPAIQMNPRGVANGRERVCRGGCWSSSEEGCRVSDRGSRAPKEKNGYTGLRLVMQVRP